MICQEDHMENPTVGHLRRGGEEEASISAASILHWLGTSFENLRIHYSLHVLLLFPYFVPVIFLHCCVIINTFGDLTKLKFTIHIPSFGDLPLMSWACAWRCCDVYSLQFFLARGAMKPMERNQLTTTVSSCIYSISIHWSFIRNWAIQLEIYCPDQLIVWYHEDFSKTT